MQVFLIHGMGRTPLSMLWLRHRLRADGHRVALFGYSPTFESLDRVTGRLLHRLRKLSPAEPYALVGHSLGTVIIRNALDELGAHPPAACFFIAPPLTASRAARFFCRFRLYRLLTGDMGQRLADDAFMNRLPLPQHLRIYAGTSGPRRAWLPFGDEPNDGLVTLAEASGDNGSHVMEVDAMHTFIMNANAVIADIREQLRLLETGR
ncbi:esterase/lipase family protein [Marinobacterium aestuariivivens]|uniref:Esterase/lipase family protein n=1 Tax=Marinobacterium aestuariivivens TaxID=1698799 RepID=A0ABW2A6D5_9GAMM